MPAWYLSEFIVCAQLPHALIAQLEAIAEIDSDDINERIDDAVNLLIDYEQNLIRFEQPTKPDIADADGSTEDSSTEVKISLNLLGRISPYFYEDDETTGFSDRLSQAIARLLALA